MYKSPTRHSRIARALAVLALVLAPAAAFAQQPLPIHIESNNADLSQQRGTSTYTGNVVLTRGGLTLTGNKLVITRINDRGNIKAVLDGSPAKFDKQPDREGDDVVTGHASQIEYANNDSTIVLRGNAVVRRGGDEINGQVIRHNLDTERTQAERGSSNNERVRITIQPESGKDQP
ncbi:Putative ABC superfamily transport protein [Salinisphaera shabanensis E1L3A]|uniref:Lipopolysaccharide export system protein LptA n=1 Tax=Salinisphaera shabanensis E1L3A TaxID=1033802 RepID=U2ESE0_9GAMM|nr:lipopolysaccharide transport periplasmic protein LptA [Salinisphaera shabanensis]ERJ20615.1 Putative ABC superfamily transport protein [Salinisphaera shabanensis E1L3A]